MSLKNPYTTFLGHAFATVSDVMDLPFSTEVTDSALKIEIRGTTIEIQTLYLISNMVVIMALIMATPLMPWRKKLVSLLFGCGLLFLYHLLSLYIILIAYGIPQQATGPQRLVRAIFLIMFSFTEQLGKLVMPFIVWLLFSSRYIFSKIDTLGHDQQIRSSGLTGQSGPDREQQDEQKSFKQQP